jgi:large subunit ribosomal protein L25
MDKLILKAEKRNLLGRKVKQLRKDGKIPANIFGKEVKSTAIQVDLKEFLEVFKKAGETGIVEVQIANVKKPVLVHNIQKDPVTDEYIHADLLQVDLTKKVTAQVRLELSGESPAEKQSLGTVVQYINEIEVEALPANLPEKFILDLSKLEKVDDKYFVKDISVEKAKVEIKNDPEQILVKVEEMKEEEIEPITPPEEEVIAEGETPKDNPEESENSASEEAEKKN